jgi:hypothetical protein
LATAALLAFIPNFLLTSAAVTNDAAITLLPVAAMVLIFRLLEQPRQPSPRQWLGLGLLLSVAVLVKVSAYPVLLVAAVSAAIIAARHKSWRVFVTAGAILSTVVLASTGWWFARNLELYQDLTGLGQMWRVWGTRAPITVAQLRVEAWNFFTTFWANFGYGNVPAPNGLYLLIAGLLGLSALGLAWRAADRLRGQRPTVANAQAALIAVWITATVAALLWYWRSTAQVTGRQIYAILPALAFYLVWGWARLVPARWQTRFAVATSAAMCGLAVYALAFILLPAYARAPRLTAAQANAAISQRLDWQLPPVAALLGYTLSPPEARAGQVVKVTLYWQALSVTPQNETVFVHLLGTGNSLVGSRDTYPGLGNDPSQFWQAGDIIQDEIPVQVAADATGPVLLDLEAGLYDLGSGQRLSIQGPDGHTITNPILGRVKLAQSRAPAPPAYPLPATSEGAPSVSGYSLSASDVAPGQSITITLQWRAAGPLNENETVFVQMLDSGGQLAAQGDGPPLAGHYPTTAWAAGEQFDDPHRIDVPPFVQPGLYDVLIGLYDPRDGTRVPVGAGDAVRLEGAIRVR